MRKKINAILIPAIILLLTAASLTLPTKTFSERENRYLASFPAFTWKTIRSGDFTEGTADYLSDHFPLRDKWIEINTRKSLAMGKTLINGVYFAKDDYLIEKYTSSANMDKIAKVVNNFCEKVEADVSFMAVPTSCAVNIVRHPCPLNANDQIIDMMALYDSLDCRKIQLSNLFFFLNQNEQVFYRLDHHWTSKGAFYASCAYKDALEYNMSESSLEHDMRVLKQSQEIEKTIEYIQVSDSFRGTLFNKVGECGLGSDTIECIELKDLDICYETEEGKYDTIYDYTKLKEADQYAFFLFGNHPIATITNGSNKEGKKLMIIKDSYANSLVPFLIKDYSEITIIDPRYYGESVSDLVNQNKIDEVLFVYNMNTLGTDSGIRRVQ